MKTDKNTDKTASAPETRTVVSSQRPRETDLGYARRIADTIKTHEICRFMEPDDYKESTIPAETPTAYRWQAQIDDLCDERNRYKAHAEALAEALRGLVADWDRAHGAMPNDHEAKQALADWEGAQS